MSKIEKSLGRRSFLATGVTGIAAAGFLGRASLLQAEPAKADPKPQAAPATGTPLVRRTLGRTGIQLPVVSMGVMNASLPDLVKRSYELGVRHFDTAAVYQRGRNEEMVGQVLKELKARDKVTLATKVLLMPPQRALPAPEQKKAFMASLEQSLKRLQTDYVDILYFHSATTLDDIHSPGVREALKELQKQGKVRFLGFSTHQNMAELIADAAKEDFWDVILTTFNFAYNQDAKLKAALEAAAAKGIGLVAMKTQASQDWYLKGLPENIQKLYEGGLKHTAVLKWVLQHPCITTAVPGYTTFQQMEENFSVARGLDYTSDEKKFLTDRQIQLALGYCRQCTECVAQCPASADVPTLMRVHMYATCYRNFEHARMTYNEIEGPRSMDACRDCEACRVKCPNGVDVAGRLGELSLIYG
jgi:predicted aldo/keto reductase-like oxidoreductase